MVAGVGSVSYSKAGAQGKNSFGTEAGKTALQGGEWGAQGYLRETETWGLSPRLSGEAAR